jgi:hypothetical protein
LRILVRDDGRGIDAQVLESGTEGHWGPVGMRERAARIGAQLKVWSEVGAGTEVELSAQLGSRSRATESVVPDVGIGRFGILAIAAVAGPIARRAATTSNGLRGSPP